MLKNVCSLRRSGRSHPTNGRCCITVLFLVFNGFTFTDSEDVCDFTLKPLYKLLFYHTVCHVWHPELLIFVLVVSKWSFKGPISECFSKKERIIHMMMFGKHIQTPPLLQWDVFQMQYMSHCTSLIEYLCVCACVFACLSICFLIQMEGNENIKWGYLWIVNGVFVLLACLCVREYH